MAENNNILLTGTEQCNGSATEKNTVLSGQEALDLLFSKLETMQKQLTVQKCACLEAQLAALEGELTAFLENRP